MYYVVLYLSINIKCTVYCTSYAYQMYYVMYVSINFKCRVYCALNILHVLCAIILNVYCTYTQEDLLKYDYMLNEVD